MESIGDRYQGSSETRLLYQRHDSILRDWKIHVVLFETGWEMGITSVYVTCIRAAAVNAQ